MRVEHLLPSGLLGRRPVRILVVGAGGTGSAIVMGLPYLHQAMRAWGHPYGLEVTLMDGDTVSETNCVRQPFSWSDVGQNKSTVLINRINLFWRTKWHAQPGVSMSRLFGQTMTRILISLLGVWTRGPRAVSSTEACRRSRATSRTGSILVTTRRAGNLHWASRSTAETAAKRNGCEQSRNSIRRLLMPQPVKTLCPVVLQSRHLNGRNRSSIRRSRRAPWPC